MLKAMTERTKVYGFLLLLALLGGGGYLVRHFMTAQAASKGSNSGKDKDKKSDGKDAVPVELAPANRDRISAYLTASANLRALREVDVASQTKES
jgi:hypothetical protein